MPACSSALAGRPWTAADAPSQAGRTAVVTGASGGLGLETARVLASRGATVVLACRNPALAQRAVDRVQAAGGSGAVWAVQLDLARLASVREAAAELQDRCPRLDLLINNAGVMTPPYQRTADGFELTFGVNHLGPFALTGLLLGPLLATPGSRVVTVSSVSHADGELNFGDLQAEQGYRADRAYGQSKLANLLFTHEFQARLQAAGATTAALAAHPGVVRTDLWRTSRGLERVIISRWLLPLNFWAVHSVERGALPTLRAATDPAARGGEYYGPSHRSGYTGDPVRVDPAPRAHDVAAQRRLWAVSEELTGVSYRLPAPA